LFVIPSSLSKEDQTKVFKLLLPLSDLGNIQKMNNDQAIADELVKVEKTQIQKSYKVGVIYCAENQITEMDMLSNENGSEDFEEFLAFLGDKVQMSRWQGYAGGLSATHDGTHSIFSKWKDLDVMFHVSTYLSHNRSDPTHIQKKRHIGNDCVVIIFKEDPWTPFNPAVMKSHFTHVYIVVQKVPSKDGTTHYKVAVISKEHVPPYDPPIPYPPIFEKGEQFREFLFYKMINGERASNFAPDFLIRNIRTRKAYLTQILSKSGIKQ